MVAVWHKPKQTWMRVVRAGFAVVAILLVAGGLEIALHSRHIRWVPVATGLDTVAHHSTLSTVKPSPKAVASYSVAPDVPKYLKIPNLAVDARVFSVGLDHTGVIGTPGNVFDTAWYTGSAKPGQPGAVLIDGHISSWTSPGVFYHLKSLQPGDQVQIVRGDDAVFTYKVVKTVTYSSDHVDMPAVLAPVSAGHLGLNLISCTGDVVPGTSEFDERIVVFTEQIK